jgi:hypothetical protein
MADKDYGKPKNIVTDVIRGATFETPTLSIEEFNGFSLQIVASDAVESGDAVTALTGTAEVTTLTFPAKAAAAVGDYISITDTLGAKWAIWLQKDPAGTADVKTATFLDEANSVSGDYVVFFNTADTRYAVSLQKIDVKTLTFAAKAATGDGDYFVISDIAGDKWAVALSKGEVKAVTTLTFPAQAAASDGDFFIIHDEAGGSWAISLDTSGSSPEPTNPTWLAVAAANKAHVDISAAATAAEVAAAVELAFDALTAVTIVSDDTAADGTMTMTRADWGTVSVTTVSNSDGSGVGSIGTTETTPGVGLTIPTGAIWTAIPSDHKDVISISTLTTAAEVAAAVEVAFDALSSGVATDDSADDGTMTFTQSAIGAVSDCQVKNKTDAGAGSISAVNTQSGREPTGAAWGLVSSGNKVQCDITGASTAAGVAAAVEVSFDSLASGIVTDDTAADGTMTFTQAGSGVVSAAIPKDYNDAGAGTISVADTTPGVNPDSAPTGAIWLSIPSVNKAACDISGATTAAQVAAAAELALDGLTGFSSVIATDDTADDGTMTLTHANRGVVANPVPKSKDDTGAGSITTAETTPGVTSKFDLTADTVTIASHGMSTGAVFQVTKSGSTFPSPLLASTNYYAIVVDANTIKIASSLNNALAGTAVNLASDGDEDDTITFTPTDLVFSVKLQASVNGTNWDDISGAAQNFTGNASHTFNVTDAQYPFTKAVFTWTSGVANIAAWMYAKQ